MLGQENVLNNVYIDNFYMIIKQLPAHNMILVIMKQQVMVKV